MDYICCGLCMQVDLYRPARKLRVGWYEDDGVFAATPGLAFNKLNLHSEIRASLTTLLGLVPIC
jgi:hypothetical protein